MRCLLTEVLYEMSSYRGVAWDVFLQRCCMRCLLTEVFYEMSSYRGVL